jgi:3-hydroxyisobutyrate dehydrogenase-like beta-hydroxyacid dehydrogenase
MATSLRNEPVTSSAKRPQFDVPADGSVGFIGLGAMGDPMARNLLQAGISLVVYDLDSSKCASLQSLGARVANSPADVASHARTIVCIVETTAQVRAVLCGENGIMETASAGHNIACMSTASPSELRRLAEELALHGVGLVDAPVSGAPEGATAGTLTIFAAGDNQALQAFEGVFRIIGRNVFKLGRVGQGTAAKLINNMLFQVNNVAVAEAMALGSAADIDLETLFEMVKVSTGYSVAFELRAPRMISGDFSPGGKVDISYKDQELETAMAKELGVPILLAALTQQVYQMARGMGFGREDGSAVFKVYEALRRQTGRVTEAATGG